MNAKVNVLNFSWLANFNWRDFKHNIREIKFQSLLRLTSLPLADSHLRNIREKKYCITRCSNVWKAKKQKSENEQVCIVENTFKVSRNWVKWQSWTHSVTLRPCHQNVISSKHSRPCPAPAETDTKLIKFMDTGSRPQRLCPDLKFATHCFYLDRESTHLPSL